MAFKQRPASDALESAGQRTFMPASSRITGKPVGVATACASHVPPAGRQAVLLEAGVKRRSITRLRRIEGQVRGLQRMVEEERYCADVLVQISSVQEALRAVARGLLRNHLEHCASAAIRQGPAEAAAMYDEIVDLFQKHQR